MLALTLRTTFWKGSSCYKMTQLPLNKRCWTAVKVGWRVAEGIKEKIRHCHHKTGARTTTPHGELRQEQNECPPPRPPDRGSHRSTCEIKDREQSQFRSTRPNERPDERRDRSQPSGNACVDNSKWKNPLKLTIDKRLSSQTNPPTDWNANALHESIPQVHRKSKMKLFIISPFLEIKGTLKLILA